MSTPTLRVVRTPDKPGPGPMPEAILRALDITIGRRMNGILSGDYRSRALGLGTELAQVREYQPGDDVRQIDWNVTARTTIPHVRVQVADRVLTTWLMLDTSPSRASAPPTGESTMSPRRRRSGWANSHPPWKRPRHRQFRR